MNKQNILKFLALCPLIAFYSCDKGDNNVAGANLALVSVHHAAIVSTGTGANLTRPVHIFINNEKVNNVSALSYPGTIGGTYIGVKGGQNTLSVRDTTSSVTTEYFTGALNVEAGKIYSVFTYDTLVAGKIKTLTLTTDLSNPGAGNAKVRFLNLSPDAPAVDFWVFRSATDSIKVASNVNYVGQSANPDVNLLSAFTTVPSSTTASYTLRVRLAGANTNLTSSSFTLADQKIYTFYLRGYRTPGKSPAIGLSSVLHN